MDDDANLLERFGEQTPRSAGTSRTWLRYRWVGLAAVGLAVLAVIAVLAAGQIGHRTTAGEPLARDAASVPAASSPGARISPSSVPSAPRSGSTSTANGQTGRAQAAKISAYLTQSKRVRHDISGAIDAINGCSGIKAAVRDLRNAADVRTRIVAALSETQVDALPHGAAVVANLRRAMLASAESDRHYAAWGRAVSGCHGHAPRTAELAAAQHSDTRATASKRRFADVWNPIAVSYGLPKQNANTF